MGDRIKGLTEEKDRTLTKSASLSYHCNHVHRPKPPCKYRQRPTARHQTAASVSEYVGVSWDYSIKFFFYQLRGFGTTCLLQAATNIPFFKITRLTAQNFSVLKIFSTPFFIAFYIWANKKFALLSTRASPSERRRIVLRSSNCFRMFSSNLENHFRLDPERGKSLDHARFRGHLWKVYLLIPLP